MPSNTFERSPIFLLCTERCGSNLIRALADAHPEIYAPHGHQGLLQIGSAQRFLNLDWNALVGLTLELATPELQKLSLSREELYTNIPEKTAATLWSYVHLKRMRQIGKPQLLVKQNRAWKFLPEISSWFPEAKFVLQVRDPRAYLHSCKTVHSRVIHYGSVGGALRVYEEDQTRFLRFFDTLPEYRRLFQTYEQLVEQPQTTLRRFCEFVGLSFQPQMLDFFQSDSEKQLAARHPQMWGNLAKPISREMVSKFRQGLRWYEIGAAEYRLGTLMERLGYALDSPRKSTLWQLYFLWDALRSGAVNRLARWFHQPPF